MIIQIYAFTDPDEAIQAAQMGVDHIGFIAGDYGLVHAELDFASAYALAHSLPVGARSVALTMAVEVNEILRMVDSVQPGIVHISTDLQDIGIDKLEELRKRLPESVQLMKAIPVEDIRSLTSAREFAALCDWLLLDTKVHGMPGVGATGRTHDWAVSSQIIQAVEIPVILAGGLTPENVQSAIQAVAPAGVDSNTSTNRPGDPVKKDLQRIRQFVEAARRAGTAPGEHP
jgi:phosphoribosylanthranilate isomerase